MKRKTTSVLPPLEYGAAEIRALRQNLGMTQSSFAETLGVSRKTVEAWEAGRNRPEGPARRIFSILQSEPSVLKHFVIG